MPIKAPHPYILVLLISDEPLIEFGMMVFCYKLRRIGVSDKYYQTIKTMYDSTNLSVKVGNYCSESNRKVMNKNRSNQKASPALKTKAGNK